MQPTSLSPTQFVNLASAEELVTRILADARFVWQTELWLDPIERSKLAGETLSKKEERVVARELLKAASRVEGMFASTIDLFQMYDAAGAAAVDYDSAHKFLLAHKEKGVSLEDVLLEASPHIGELLGARGFPAELFGSVLSAANDLGISFNEVRFIADKAGIAIPGAAPHRVLRDPTQKFPEVDGDTFVREGLLGSYQYVENEDGTCRTDAYQSLLAFAKYGSEAARERARVAMTEGLRPYPGGIAFFVVIIIIVVIAIVAAIIIGLLCSARQLTPTVCDISLKILAAVITIGICMLADQDKDHTFSCGVTSGGSDG